MGLHDTRVPVVEILCWAINNTQSVPCTAVTSPAVVHCFCAICLGMKVSSNGPLLGKVQGGYTTPMASCFMCLCVKFRHSGCSVRGCVHTHTILSTFTHLQVMVCLQVLLVSHHHHIVSHPLLLLLFTPQQLLPAGTMCRSCTLSMEH